MVNIDDGSRLMSQQGFVCVSSPREAQKAIKEIGILALLYEPGSDAVRGNVTFTRTKEILRS